MLGPLDPDPADDGPAPADERAAWWPVVDGPGGGPPSAGAEGDEPLSRSTSRRGSDAEEGQDAARRRGSLSAVAEAYTAAHGHPTTHSGFEHAPDGGPRRWSVGARTAVVAAVAVLLLAVGLGAWALADADDVRPVASLREEVGRPAGEVGDTPVPDGPAASVTGDGAASARAATTGEEAPPVSDVVVHVVGAVAAPGLVTVPQGARVADALTAAGDATPDADLAGVNLAREVVDGEQIVVPRPGEAVAAAPQPPPGGGPAAGPLDLNTADETALDGLPGIGPVLAARIVEWREANGRFTSVEELGEVSGIGDALLGTLRDQVRV